MWKKGQKLVCIDNYGGWRGIFGEIVPNGPKLRIGQIVTFDSYSQFFPDSIILVEYKSAYAEYSFKARRFRPLIGDSAMTELTSFEPVKETSDCPIQMPERV